MKKPILILIIVAIISCNKNKDIVLPVVVEEPCTLDMANYDYSFGITYDEPQKYLVPGDQSDLDDNYLTEIINSIGTPENNLSGILAVCHWVNQTFTFEDAGGSMIGQKHVNELFESKIYYGCHSAALVISSILREFGFPTVMIETASIVWAKAYNAGTSQGFSGHVMTEVYVDNRWILLDNNCTYVKEYQCLNPYISTLNRQGLFTYAKGVDIWDYGVFNDTDTHAKMIYFADHITCFKDLFGSVNYTWGN